jgi:hypothetical protein
MILVCSSLALDGFTHDSSLFRFSLDRFIHDSSLFRFGFRQVYTGL